MMKVFWGLVFSKHSLMSPKCLKNDNIIKKMSKPKESGGLTFCAKKLASLTKSRTRDLKSGISLVNGIKKG